MDRIKTFGKYIIWIILFYIFSNILIFIGLNSTYKKMYAMTEINNDQIEVKRAESTLVNGRIRILIKNNEENDLNGKYLKISIYADNKMLMGNKYIDISDLGKTETREFNTYYKFEHTKYYDISITDKKEDEIKTEAFSEEEISQTLLALLLLKLCIKI